MFKFFKSFAIAAFFFTLAAVSLVFAQDSTSSNPGILETQFFNLILQIPMINDIAGYFVGILYATLIGLVYRVILEILKKLPTKWGEKGPNFVWKFASIFFGPSIMYYNAMVKSKDPLEQQRLQQKIIDSVNNHFEKHNVLKK